MELYKSKYSDNKKSRKSRRDDDVSRSFRNSRNDRFSRDRKRESATVTCADCGTECEVPFVPKTDRPVYCSDCFRQNKPQSDDYEKYSRNDNPRNDRFSRNDRESRYSRDDRRSRNDRYSRDERQRESATVTCADCGTDCEVPFVPKHDRPVYCSDCFRQNKSRNTDDDRFSRNDRESRYSREDRRSRNDRPRNDRRSDRRSSRDEPRSKNSKSEKFLKKQESFYSNGSDKFYESLKEKLFEILGGKICSSCGFRDERALGFTHKYDENAFDDIHRGGAASSWGKYISEPNLAREELKVLCLNCNQINQPVSKPKNESRPKRKKSKYFPR